VNRRETSRSDEQARVGFVDQISLAMLQAQARWIEKCDCVELRRALPAVPT
jgi:hypothetical protein